MLSIPDAELARLAHGLRDASWADRVRHVNAAVCDRLEHLARVTGVDTGRRATPAALARFERGLVAIHDAIARMLDVWGAAEPVDNDAAQLFALSLSSAHRAAYRDYALRRSELPEARLFLPRSGLDVLYGLSVKLAPAMGELHRRAGGPRPSGDGGGIPTPVTMTGIASL